MKKFITFLCLIALIAVSNCSEIPENNDPILGIWAQIEITTIAEIESTHREEWIFNDAFLGRYQTYDNENLTFFTDFSWTLEDNVYTIQYNVTDIPEAKVHLLIAEQPQTLQYTNGSFFATRE